MNPPNAPAQREPDYTMAEAAGIFGVTTATVYKMLARGELRSYTVGRSRRITRESVERVRQGRVAG